MLGRWLLAECCCVVSRTTSLTDSTPKDSIPNAPVLTQPEHTAETQNICRKKRQVTRSALLRQAARRKQQDKCHHHLYRDLTDSKGSIVQQPGKNST